MSRQIVGDLLRGDLKSEEARIAAARSAIGPDVLLMLDANNAWSDVPTALRYMDRFAPYDPYWIEEPFEPDEYGKYMALAKAVKTPIAAGEEETTLADFERLVTQAIIPERASRLPQRDRAQGIAGMQSEWEAFKAKWAK